MNLPEQRDWHQAVQEAMRAATEQEIITRYGSLDVSFNYRWEHVTSVVSLAKKLAQLTGADKDVVEAAAWLHDIRKVSGSAHAVQGAEFASAFLKETDFPPEKIDRVAEAIREHIGLWLEEPLTNLEAMVLWDADKLAKIGLTAVFHWIGGSLAGSEIKDIRALIQDMKQVDWQEKTVASMHSEPAKRAARIRLDHYHWLWKALEEELNGDDLLP
ncbi:MAG: HD domain-containing protein [Candidatus Promineifilaceae bacterium]|jgi:uncharacterized protein